MEKHIGSAKKNGSQAQGFPFKVPEGYFDTLQERVMARLPEREAVLIDLSAERRRQRRLFVRWAAAAVCLCMAVGGSVAYWSQQDATGQARYAEAQQGMKMAEGEDSYIDEVADYTMMDNADIYTYLSSVDY